MTEPITRLKAFLSLCARCTMKRNHPSFDLAASSAPKNSICLKPNIPAIVFAGKLSIFIFKSNNFFNFSQFR